MNKLSNSINLIGSRCPDTIMKIRKKFRKFKKGEKINIITDDLSSKREIQLFCIFMGHQLIYHECNKIPYYFSIKVGKNN